ncbi:MAG: YfhO family protein, partial [Lachnospira sp.]|nr:YfhO family protein [Lachnospira sp.]
MDFAINRIKSVLQKVKCKEKQYWISVFGAPVIVGALILLVYAIKGVYPFGGGDIAYYDMGPNTVPVYYNTWDILHGTKALFWDWYSGGGVTTADIVGNHVVSPFNLFFLFVERDMIMESMSLFLMLKVCVAAGFMSMYFRNSYSGTHCFWHVAAGVLYASSGYILQYYSNIHFLDLVAIFPLIMHFTDKLLYKRKCVGFCITMALGFAVNTYFMVAVSIYLIIYSADRVKNMDKNEKKSAIALLGIGAVVAALFSSVMLLPTAVSLLQSQRVSVGQGSEFEYITNAIEDEFYVHKTFMLFGSEIAIGAVIAFLLVNRKNLRNILSEIYLMVLMIIPIFVEMSNWNWHVSGYVHFPMRFGYMLTFSALLLVGRVLQMREQEKDPVSEKKGIREHIPMIGAVMIVITVAMTYLFAQLFIYKGIRDFEAYSGYWLIFVLAIVVYALALLCEKGKVVRMLCGIMVITQAALGWYGFLAPSWDWPYEDADVIIRDVQQIGDVISDGEPEFLNRVKDEESVFNHNYGFILHNSTMSNWTWGTKATMRELVNRLGYTYSNLRMTDSGGTMFSDAVFNIRTVVSRFPKDDRILAGVERKDEYYISSLKYNYPFGVVVNEEILEWTSSDTWSELQYNNELFKAVNSTSADLIRIYDCDNSLQKVVKKNGCYEYVYNISVDNLGILYMEPQSVSGAKGEYMGIRINGEDYFIPNMSMLRNITYPTDSRNCMLELGVFDSENVEIIVTSIYPQEGVVSFGVLDVATMAESIKEKQDKSRQIEAGKDSLTIQLTGGNGELLMLPVAYDSSYVVTNNGEKIDCHSAIDDALMLIPLSDGENNITVKFRPAGLTLGIILSLIGIVMLV